MGAVGGGVITLEGSAEELRRRLSKYPARTAALPAELAAAAVGQHRGPLEGGQSKAAPSVHDSHQRQGR